VGIKKELVQLLSDGAVHSGTDLAGTLNCSRTAVWKQLHKLESLGLNIRTSQGRGYQLERPIELLDRSAILERLDAAVVLESLDVFSVTDSTNERLRSMPPPEPGRMRVALAEYQTGGRGRRGRTWFSPFGSGLCLSVSWCFAEIPGALPALSLASGVAVNRALIASEADGIGLKWPNDIVAGDRKLGGLLVDVQGESGGPITAVVGVGINIDVSDELQGQLSGGDGLPPAGLRQVGRADTLSRNELAADMIEKLHAMLVEFERSGFVNFADEWRSFDRMKGRKVSVKTGQREYHGVAAGIAPDGALLLDEDGGTRAIVAGEVSLRLSS
jgi:BirA family biotin operon repressor/biotin-[acetyl-CoA-carboxylase] ligase